MDNCDPPAWDSSGHFFAAAAEAMRRILIDLGFADVLASERDLAWSFSVVGFNHSLLPGRYA